VYFLAQLVSMALSNASANWLVPAVPPTSRVIVLRSAYFSFWQLAAG
jgi:hypothetical protein